MRCNIVPAFSPPRPACMLPSHLRFAVPGGAGEACGPLKCHPGLYAYAYEPADFFRAFRGLAAMLVHSLNGLSLPCPCPSHRHLVPCLPGPG